MIILGFILQYVEWKKNPIMLSFCSVLAYLYVFIVVHMLLCVIGGGGGRGEAI